MDTCFKHNAHTPWRRHRRPTCASRFHDWCFKYKAHLSRNFFRTSEEADVKSRETSPTSMRSWGVTNSRRSAPGGSVSRRRLGSLPEKQQRQGAGIMGLTKPAYRSRNSRSATSRARTSSALSEEVDGKSQETSPTRLKPNSMSLTHSRARASSVSSSSEESVEPQK
jgi:hypothetical protein